jgi:thiol-disulfide isomerase/thioredoxin
MTHRLKPGRRFALGLAVLAGLCLAGASAQAGVSRVSAEEDASRPFVVKIHADWCGTCTRLEPTLDALEKEVGDGARIVVLDVTDKQTLAGATAEADRLGIREFFETYKSKTGTVGVLDGASREPVRVMKGELDVAEYQRALAKAAARGSS